MADKKPVAWLIVDDKNPPWFCESEFIAERYGKQAKPLVFLDETATQPADAALADDPRDIRDEEITLEASDYARRMMQDLGYAQHESRDPLAQNHTTIAAAKHFTHALAAAALRARAVPEGDVIEKIEEYGGHRENEGGSYATFQKSEARRYRAEADEVLGEIRAMLAASKAGEGK